MTEPLVSFAITVKDELEELGILLEHLKTNVSDEMYPFEIVALIDRGGDRVDDVVKVMKDSGLPIRYRTGKFDGDFGSWKNILNAECKGRYIFQLDADEIPSTFMLEKLRYLVEANPGVELFFIPRINIVRGITREDVDRWGWKGTIIPGIDLAVYQYPDYQGRLYRNDPEIKWVGYVHERIEGSLGQAWLPAFITRLGERKPHPLYAITHNKTIEKQRAQNERYSLMMSSGGNS